MVSGKLPKSASHSSYHSDRVCHYVTLGDALMRQATPYLASLARICVSSLLSFFYPLHTQLITISFPKSVLLYSSGPFLGPLRITSLPQALLHLLCHWSHAFCFRHTEFYLSWNTSGPFTTLWFPLSGCAFILLSLRKKLTNKQNDSTVNIHLKCHHLCEAFPGWPFCVPAAYSLEHATCYTIMYH